MPGIRELSIQYGSLIINEATGRFIDGKIQINKSYTATTVTFSFVIRKATESDFAVEVAAVEAAFRAPFQNLVITQGINTLLSLSHSSNTGMNAKPTIAKSEHPADTGRSRRYTATIVFEMPADNVAGFLADGLRESSIDVRFSPSGRRTVTISGVFTALSGNTARAQYDATIDAYATSVLGALGGTYELAEKPRTEADGTNKLLLFTHTYDELIYPQAKTGESYDDPDLIRQQFTMNLIKSHLGDTLERVVNRMVTVAVNYEAWVVKTNKNLKGKWDSIKEWIVSTAKSVFSLSSVALVDENVILNQDDNRISASLSIRAALKGGTIIEEQITYGFETIFGKVLVPVWSGDEMAKYVYQGPATKRLTISITAKVMGERIMKARESLTRANKQLAGGKDKIVQISSRMDSRPLVVGEKPHQHTITEISSVDVYEAYKEPIAGTTMPVSLLPAESAGKDLL